uniref:LIM zinc-binding domain-containing protein n=1 Tax=Macrostomum lignano TaxID=282301 RepID=A0A1I8JP68_9PLAT
MCSLCAGCGDVITDPYILRVQPDLEWHARCLKCAECSAELNEARTCYVRDGKTYCKADYCSSTPLTDCFREPLPPNVNIAFSKTDFVMRARSKVYHIDCFRCFYTCSRQLIPGEEFAVRKKRQSPLSSSDFDAMELLSKSPMLPSNNNSGSRDSIHEQDLDSRDGIFFVEDLRRPRKIEERDGRRDGRTRGGGAAAAVATAAEVAEVASTDEDSLSPSVGNSETQSNCDRSSISGGGGGGALPKQSAGGGSSKRNKSSGKDSKTTRVRTVLNEKQLLHTLRTCYAANRDRDALMKEPAGGDDRPESQGHPGSGSRISAAKTRRSRSSSSRMEHQIQQKRTLSGVPMIATSPLLTLSASSSGAGIRRGAAAAPPAASHRRSDQTVQPPPPPPPSATTAAAARHFQQLVSAYSESVPV